MLSVLSVFYVSIVVLWLSSKDTYTNGLTWWYATVRFKLYRLDTSLYLSKHSEIRLQNYKDNSIVGSVRTIFSWFRNFLCRLVCSVWIGMCHVTLKPKSDISVIHHSIYNTIMHVLFWIVLNHVNDCVKSLF